MTKSIGFALVLACAAAAFAQPWTPLIRQYNDHYLWDPDDPNIPNEYYYTVNNQNKQVTIHHADANEPFDFEAIEVDPQNMQYKGPGNIDQIRVDSGAGSVKITLSAHYPGAEVGAYAVRILNLTAEAGVVSQLGDFSVASTLGDPDDPNDPNVAIRVNEIAGDVRVGGIAGNMYVDRLASGSSLIADALYANLNVTDPNATNDADFSIGSLPFLYPVDITIAGSMMGDFQLLNGL